MSATRYPLAWPDGWPRAKSRRSSSFKVSFDKALRELEYEVERLGGKYPLLSTNVPLRMDGQMRRDSTPGDPGVAVYFELKSAQKVFACDTFYTVRENIRAICLTIAAIRTIQRNGATAMLERTLSAFEALPTQAHWRTVLGVDRACTIDDVKANYVRLARARHPDNGGSNDLMVELNAARDAALRELEKGT